MLSLLIDFWSAVREAFEDAWDKPPRQSRLMHGVGVPSLGFLMGAIFDRYSRLGAPGKDDFAGDLSELSNVCGWTHGYWDFGPGTQLLTNYLLHQYKALVWTKPLPKRQKDPSDEF